jgi:DNA-binding MurR/RpiR family transcriptional regulator
MEGPLATRLMAGFDAMSPQLRKAARFVIDRPREVALLSMREQARRAGVQPATMTRLAQFLGLKGYEAVRSMHAEVVRRAAMDFSGKAGRQISTQRSRGELSLSGEIIAALVSQTQALGERESLDRIASAAALLSRAERIFCLGLRSSFPVAWHAHYVMSLVRTGVILVDGIGGLVGDALRSASRRDALLVASVHPYTRATLASARYAAERRLPIVAITDSAVAPLAELADIAVLASTDSPAFYHSMVPAFAAAELLAAVVAGRGGAGALQALRRTEEQLGALGVHSNEKRGRKP